MDTQPAVVTNWRDLTDEELYQVLEVNADRILNPTAVSEQLGVAVNTVHELTTAQRYVEQMLRADLIRATTTKWPIKYRRNGGKEG